ncbi:MAG: hypothetical protein Q9228_003085, partial [Teloschistes exilis]
MLANSVSAAFWLFWHTLRDPSLLAAATAEITACTTTTAPQSGADDHNNNNKNHPPFDTPKLMNQPLLQSLYAETLRKYIAVYITRTTEYSDAEILDHRMPRGRMVIVNSATAHMDKRNWDHQASSHPATSFWAERFLVPNNNTKPGILRADSGYASLTSSSTTAPPTSPQPPSTSSGPHKFSLDRHKGAWIPFGGGPHQCPGRHW